LTELMSVLLTSTMDSCKPLKGLFFLKLIDSNIKGG